MVRTSVIWLVLMHLPVQAEQASCPTSEIVARGSVSETRFFPAPVARVHEVVADSMQAIGVLLYESTDALVRGERRPARVDAMRLPSGNEAVHSSLQAAEQDGTKGTLVRV